MTQMELLAPCRLPTKGTQAYELLMAMQGGKRLTIWNAMMEHHCGALHQRMNDLKALGWPIKRQEITVNGKRVAEFSL